ncbi:MAG: hypothetical protein ACE366_30800 [Bradymonadia bacterium]
MRCPQIPLRRLLLSRAFAAIAVSALLGGCGEGEVVQLEVIERPVVADYQTVINPLLEQMGCGNPGCHISPLGGLLLIQSPDPIQLDDNFKSVKSLIDPDDPEDNPFVNATVGENHPIVCAAREDCAVRKMVAWIGTELTGDALNDLCDSSEDACF